MKKWEKSCKIILHRKFSKTGEPQKDEEAFWTVGGTGFLVAVIGGCVLLLGVSILVAAVVFKTMSASASSAAKPQIVSNGITLV